MEMEKFIQNFAEAIDVESSLISANTEFRELDEWNSLAGLSVISMFEEEYGIELSILDLRSSCTVNDLFNLVK